MRLHTIKKMMKKRDNEYIALFILYTLAFAVTGTMSFVNLAKGYTALFIAESIFSLFSLFAMFRMMYKEINFQRYAIIFLIMLMAVLLTVIVKVPSAARAVIFVFFFPFATVILLEKRYAIMLMSLFMTFLGSILFFNLSSVYFPPLESTVLLISVAIFALFSGFYVYAVKEANRIIAMKDSSLKELEARFKMITDIAFEALIITKNAVIIQGNDKAVEMFGYKDQKDILNEHLQKFVTPQSMQKIAKHVQNNDESAYVIEGFKKDGSTFPSRVRGKNISYGGESYRVSAIEDISNLEDAKEEINKLVSAIEQSSQMIFITDVEGHIEYVNKSFEDNTGYTSAEAIGQTPRILSSGQHDRFFYHDMWRTIQSGAAWSGEMFNHRKDGTTLIVQNFVNSIKNSRGEITHYISTQEDVTQQKEQEKIVLSQMKQAQMGEMLSMIAHQWRQPLSTISTVSANIQLGLQLETMEETEIVELLHLIDEHIFFLSDTINDFRNFFQPDKNRHSSKVSAIINKVIQIIDKQLVMNAIEVNISNEVDPLLFTYTNEVIQVLLSLFNNIIDKVKDEDLKEQHIDICVVDDLDKVTLSIQDNAGGIPESIINEVFIPYFSTKKEKQGTGLGLYMSKTIIEDHCKGKIQVINQDGGARFIIELPKHDEAE